MDENSWLLLSFKVNEDGIAERVHENDLNNNNISKSFSWIHLNANDPKAENWLYEKSELEPIWIMSLLAPDTRPSISQLANGALIIILRGINLNINEEPEDMVSIRIYLDKDKIISVRLRRLKAVEEIEKKFIHGKGPKNTSEFIATLVHFLCDKLDPMLSQMNEEIDEIEEEILDKPDILLRQRIIDLRKRAILFKRYLAPQRDVIHSLIFIEKEWLYPKDRHILSESLNKTIRYLEDLDSMRERTQVVQDELNNYLTDRLNKNTYNLSVMSSVFLPLTFLTGLLGVNLAGIPGAESPLAFGVFCLIIIMVFLIQAGLFKWFDWF